jgi:hypothetical protein
MAVRPYDDTDSAYGGATTSGGVGGRIFLWTAWALAAAFWAFMLTTAGGIFQALSRGPAGGPGPGEVDAGGISWLLINFVGGVVVLGGALAYGLYRYSSRDKGRDAATEAATHALYDITEAAGGDDEVTRSPEARRPEDRDAMRVARGEQAP